MSWTDERVALLKKLWGDGKTAAEIAKELGGVTRNAVIGKAHRLNLSGRASPIQQNKPVKKVVKVAPKTETKSKEKTESLPNGTGIEMNELKASSCRWPYGDPREKEFRFCGEDAFHGLPYCEDHARAAYKTASRKKTKIEDELANVDGREKKAATG